MQGIEAGSDDAPLLKKQEDLKAQLAAGEFKTFGRIIAEKTGSYIQYLSKNSDPLPYWYGMAVVILIIMLLGLLTSIILKETDLSLELVFFEISIGGLTFIFLIALEAYISHIFSTFHTYLIDGIESISDLEDLQHRLSNAFNTKKQMIFAIGYAVFLSVSATIIYTPIFGFSFGIGVVAVALNFLGGTYFYFAFQGLAILARLSQYRYKLYAADPSSSEVVDRLSDMLTFGVYLVAIYAALLTLIIAWFGGPIEPGIVIAIVIGWGPTIVFFALNQFIMSRIITNGKWKTLNDIQTQVEDLQTQDAVLSEDTLGHIDKLMDYHDRIKATKNSALDLRAGLNFLNSLLLPVFAFIIANLDTVLELLFS